MEENSGSFNFTRVKWVVFCAVDDIQEDEEEDGSSSHQTVPLLPGQLEPSMDLIIQTLEKCFSRSYHITFAKQLLHLSLEFLVYVVKMEAESDLEELLTSSIGSEHPAALTGSRRHQTSETSEGSLSEQGLETVSMDTIAHYMKRLRSFLPGAAASQIDKEDAEQVMEGAPDPGTPDLWENMSSKVITIVCISF